MIRTRFGLVAALFVVLAIMLGSTSSALAASKGLGKPKGGNPQQGSIGLVGKKPGPPPSQGATIVQPSNGQTFTNIPVTVRGFCPGDVLVKIFDNKIFVGSAKCKGNSYSLKVDLFSGKNQLIAKVFDNLGQQGPDSNKVNVNFKDAEFAAFGSHVSLTSDYARRGAAPNQKLTWPVILSGGVGPYAMSVDWGDGSPVKLKSVPFPGVIKFSHTYKQAGVYNVIFKATDKNGTTAYLQVIAVISGKPPAGGAAGGTGKNQGQVPPANCQSFILGPGIAWIAIAIISFFLGRRFELLALRKHLEQDYKS
jgi:hypothetical protein